MEENSYIVQGDKLLYVNKVLFKAKGLIEKYLVMPNGIVILTDNSNSKEMQNVYYYDFNGELKWQIPSADELHFNNCYTSIYLSRDNELQAYSKNGVEYTLNEKDGSIIKKELIK